MKRLVTFGCSYTYGIAVNGTTTNDPPSNLAWPEKLGQHMNRSVINRAKPGASNLEILWRLLHFQFEPLDVCVIMWSHFNRECFLTKNGPKKLNFGENSRTEKHWLAVHSEYDHNQRNWLNIHHANQHLKALGIENFYHLFGGDPGDHSMVPANLPLDNVIDIEFENIDYGDDDSHPGNLSHALLASKVFEEIKVKDTK